LGYRVALAGKRHFGPEPAYPFEYIVDHRGTIEDERFDAVREFVNRNPDQPYCLVFCSHQPHKPWDVGNPDIFDADKLSVPEYLPDTPETRSALVQYYAEITFLDGQLGRCMQIVEESGRSENTMLIFTSEQGAGLPFAKWTCYENGLRTGFIVRWPDVVKAGSRNSALIQYVDFMPTLLEILGENIDFIDTGRPDFSGKTGFDGRSFLYVLLGKSNIHRDYVYGVHTTRGIINGSESYPIRSVRNERFKFISNLNHQIPFSNVLTGGASGVLQSWLQSDDAQIRSRGRFYIQRPREEIYDLATDPFELINRADDSRYRQVRNALVEHLERWMQQQGDDGTETEMLAETRQAKYIRKH
jgi:uncharacterized sulfatase